MTGPIPKPEDWDASWDGLQVPAIDDPDSYALEITGDSMLPVYREGDFLVVSPNAKITPGDRVVVRLASGAVLARTLRRRTETEVQLLAFATGAEIEVYAAGNVRSIEENHVGVAVMPLLLRLYAARLRLRLIRVHLRAVRWLLARLGEPRRR